MRKIICPKCKYCNENDATTCVDCGNNIRGLIYDDSNILDLNNHPIFKNWTSLLLFFMGFAYGGILIISLLVEALLFFVPDGNYIFISALNNFLIYFILALVFVFVLGKTYIIKLLSTFLNKRVVLYGVICGISVIFSAIIYNIVIQLSGVSITDNQNQTIIEQIIIAFPFVAFLIIVILGPLCEEITYRLGLFSFIYEKNKYLAYIITLTIFGLIHFSFDQQTIVNELINLPIYLISGFIFCFTYQKYGFAAALIGHSFNNLYSFVVQFI